MAPGSCQARIAPHYRLQEARTPTRAVAARRRCLGYLLLYDLQMSNVIGVGIVGLSAGGGWAGRAHAPALAALDDYELRGVAGSSASSAEAAGEAFDVPLRFASARELAEHEAIDLVVVAVKVPHHLELVRAALEAGKMVYCEWPLGKSLTEAEELSNLARSRGVRAAVGLQARSSPTFRYVRDLVRGRYVGAVLSTSVIASGANWGATFRPGGEYMLDRANGATMLSVPFGHTVDVLTMVLGEFTELTATLGFRRSEARNQETGEVRAMSAEDQIAVIGTLESGAVASLHFRGGLCRGTNFHWEINGTDGDLMITLDFARPQFGPVRLLGAHGAETELHELKVPDHYVEVPGMNGREDEPGYNIAHAYTQFHRDLTDGGRTVPDFEHAVTAHRLLDRIERAAGV
jgi:predicted dehydrogenase